MPQERSWRHRVIQTRRARSTGTEIEVSYEPAKDPECRWQTTCLDHGNCCGHATRALAVSFAAAPEEWCADCQTLKKENR